jgi:hypothetical protein
MHTDTKPSSAGSANRTEGSCCGHGTRAPADSAKPSAAPERTPVDQPTETTREAAQGKSKGCCCGS